MFERERPEVLSHHAAQMDVRRSVADPVFDAQVNLLGLLNLLEHGRRHGLRRVLFASSGGAVYGEQERFPARETDATAPVSPYGVAKLASERYLYFYSVRLRHLATSPCATPTSTARARTRTARPAWSRSSPASCSR